MGNIVSTSSVETIKNIGLSALQIVSTPSDIDKAMNIFTSVYNRSKNNQIQYVRSIVDSITPVVLLVNYSDARKELQKYATLVDTINRTFKTETADTVSTLRDVQLQSSFQKSTEQDTQKFIDLLLASVKAAVDKYIAKIPQTNKVSYTALYDKINDAINNTSGLQSLAAVQLKVFGGSGVYLITDRVGRDVDRALVFSDFVTSTAELKRIIREEIEQILKEFSNNSKLSTVLLDFGHVAASRTIPDKNSTEYFANFPKQTQVLMELVLESTLSEGNSISGSQITDKQLEQETDNFIQITGQYLETIEVYKEFSEGFLRLFVKIGGQVLRFENSVVNRRRGSRNEKAYPGGDNQKVLNLLKNAILKNSQALQLTATKLVGLFKFKSSPSLKDYVNLLIKNASEGKKTPGFNNKVGDKALTNLSSKITTPKAKTKVSVKKQALNLKLPGLKSFNIQKATVNLVSLQNLINQNLVQQVKNNMGTGDRRDILNLRSGRFAESVKIERMSQSREGMITAFYSYMKNPYATFSTGGLQGSPKTRDPKLLISRSIRELATQQVQNRLRSVVV